MSTHPDPSAMGMFIVLYKCLILFAPIGFACQLLDKFDMPEMFKEGDIMIGGIFPIFNKQENIMASYENKPPKAECKG